jgi:hypothetical protein
MQSANSHSPLYRRSGEPKREQLPAGDYTVLVRGEVGDRSFVDDSTWSRYAADMTVN